jgi:hypothetical protein
VKVSRPILFAVVASIAVVMAIIAGISIIGSPPDVRARRLDMQRVNDLRNIVTAVNTYHRTRGELPDRLDRLQEGGKWPHVHLSDAETGRPYEYRVKNASAYELCAQFNATSDDRVTPSAYPPPFWRHASGRQCFGMDSKLPVR